MISGLFEDFIKEKRYLNNLSERTLNSGLILSSCQLSATGTFPQARRAAKLLVRKSFGLRRSVGNLSTKENIK